MDKRKEIINYFQILKKQDLLGASYCFVGQDYSLVTDIIKLISCQNDPGPCGSCWDCGAIDKANHPDVFVAEPEGMTLKIDTMKEAMRFLSLKGFRLTKKTLIVKNADALSGAAANAFLKTLEEPPKNSFIAVVTPKLDALIPTIISRCRKIFLPPSKERYDFDFDRSAEFIQGQDLEIKDRKKFSDFLFNLINFIHGLILAKKGYQNNYLPKNKGCEIILKSKTAQELDNILKQVLEIYSVAKSININLGLNLIKTKIN